MLKQSAGYSSEAQNLRYLYDYMMRWSSKTEMDLNIKTQVIDYICSIALMRSGERLPQDDFSTFDTAYYGKNVVIYSAGTFGQQLVNRFKETEHCKVVAWIDDDYWEYRRCCLDVDPVESVSSLSFDYILIATVDGMVAENAERRLMDLGIGQKKILKTVVPKEKEGLLNRFLDVDAIKAEEAKRKRGITSHA